MARHQAHLHFLQPRCAHSALREGVRLGFVTASATWLWVAIVDTLMGRPFHTFETMGGVAAFTAMHYLLHATYAIAVIAVIHGSERAPSLIIGAIFGVVLLEVAIAMMTNVLAEATLGNSAWVAIFGGSIIATALGLVLLSRTHPLRKYLRRAEDEI